MKKKELQKLFDKAEVTKVDDREVQTYRVHVEKLNREFYIETDKKRKAAGMALDLVLNESDAIRGFEITE